MTTTVKIDDPEDVINALQARIKQLEDQMSYERRQQLDGPPGVIVDTLKHLRIYGVILIHVGGDNLADVRKLPGNSPAMREALDQAWPLAAAPLSDDVKDAFRTAANYGLDRWF
jgi:hypothetical protein